MKFKTKLFVLFSTIFFALTPIYSSLISATNVESPTNYANDPIGLFNEVKDGVVMITTILDDSMGAGTGMIYKEDDTHLFIITNYHVVEGGVKYAIDFNSKERRYGTLVGYDDYFDVALLKCEKPNTFKVLTYANSNLNKPGEEVIAIGNPSSPELTFTTTKGIIANTNIIMSNDDFYLDRHLTMLDLALNPGNSGGPSFNVYGQVIGINSVKFANNGFNYFEGLNFMIPISDALNVINRIEQHKYHVFVRPFIGNFSISDVKHFHENEKLSMNLSRDFNKGVYIKNLNQTNNNPLFDAGLPASFIITRFAGQEVLDQVSFRRILYSLNIYQKVDIEYIDLLDSNKIKTSKVAINALVVK